MAADFTKISPTLHIVFIAVGQIPPMNMKAILWFFGATIFATGLVLGLRSAARAVGIDFDTHHYQSSPSLDPDEQRVRHPHISDVSFSPDAFRDELLK